MKKAEYSKGDFSMAFSAYRSAPRKQLACLQSVASLWGAMGALGGQGPSKTLGRGHNPLVEDRLLCKFIHRAM